MEGVEPVRPGGDAVLGRSSSRLGKLADRMADRKIVARLFTRSQRHGRAVAILTPVEAESARCVHTSRRLGLPLGCWPYGRPCCRWSLESKRP
jgi:hypothetical protein